MRSFLNSLLGGLLVAVLPWMTAAQAQDAALEAGFTRGVAALEAGDPDRALAELEAVFAANAAFFSPEHGAAAYWLGRAYEASGQPERGQAVWKSGLLALDEAGRFDARLADAFLWSKVRAGGAEDLAEAAHAYRYLLRHVGSPEGGTDALLRRHVAQVALLLPEDVRLRVLHERPDRPSEAPAFAADAASHLLTWWRSQDPLPATVRNERLEEHLRRVAYATQRYARPDRRTNLDDRGEVYVRFGRPYWQRRIAYDDPEFRREVLRFGVALSSQEFPENEVWGYPHIDRAGYFVFVKRHKYYQVGTVKDLLPQQLAQGFSATGHGLNKAYSAMMALRYIYRHLASYHVDFDPLFARIEDYTNHQQTQANAAQHGSPARLGEQRATVGAGFDRRQVFANPSLGIAAPHRFVQQAIQQSEREDHQAYLRREEAMPHQYTEVFGTVERLPIAARAARFLETDGTTRTEIYWSPLPEAFLPSKAQQKRLGKAGYGPPLRYVLRQSTVQHLSDYQKRLVRVQHFPPVEERTALPVQTTVVRGDTGRYHLAVQWETLLRAERRPEDDPAQAHPPLKAAVHRFDSLDALSADPRRLEMSDLRPLWEGPAKADGAPYPFSSITLETPLALYFEVYHLSYGADDQVHYSVEYELRRGARGGTLLRVLRGRDAERTAARTRYTARSTKVGEYVHLDLSGWRGAGPLEVTVRVRDETTGQQTERSITFELAQGTTLAN